MAANPLRDWAERWSWVFAANALLPLALATATGPGGLAGFAVAAAVLWGLGFAAGATGATTRDVLTFGGLVVAGLQIIPLPQGVAVGLAVAAWHASFGPADLPPSPAAAFTITLSTGVLLEAFAAALGYYLSGRPILPPEGAGDPGEEDA